MASTTQQPSQSLAKRDPKMEALDRIGKILEAKKQELVRALPAHITPDKQVRAALTMVSDDGKLLQCDPITIYRGVLEASQAGLILDGFTGDAYLVPFWNSGRKCFEAQFMPGYRGLIKLALQSGKIDAVRAKVVYEGDHFEWEEGLVKRLIHKPTMDVKHRGPILCAYAVAALKGLPPEQHEFVVLVRDEIEAIRLRSQAGHDKDGNPAGPWKTDWAEMAKKTCVRNLCKYLKLSPELDRVVTMDEYREAGVMTIDGNSGKVEDGSVANISDKANTDLKAKILQAKNGTTSPEAPKAETGPAILSPEQSPATAPEDAPPDTEDHPAAQQQEQQSETRTPDAKPEVMLAEIGEDMTITGTLVEMTTPKKQGNGTLVSVSFKGQDGKPIKLSVWDKKLQAALVEHKTQGQVCTLVYKEQGNFLHGINLLRVGNREWMRDGTVVLSSDEAAGYKD